MSMAEAGRPIVDWSPRDDAHSGLRHTDRPAARPTGRVQHGYNRVQEIVSDTPTTCYRVEHVYTQDRFRSLQGSYGQDSLYAEVHYPASI